MWKPLVKGKISTHKYLHSSELCLVKGLALLGACNIFQLREDPIRSHPVKGFSFSLVENNLVKDLQLKLMSHPIEGFSPQTC